MDAPSPQAQNVYQGIDQGYVEQPIVDQSADPLIVTREHLETELAARDRLLVGVSAACTCLLTYADLTQAISEALAALGHAARVERVYVFEQHPHQPTGIPAMTIRYEWTAPGISPSMDQAYWHNQTYQALGVERWHRAFLANEAVWGVVAALPENEQRWLIPEGILSLLMVPIMIEGQLWGYMGMDACQEARIWPDSERALLQAFAGSIGGAIDRHSTDIALHQSESRLQNLATNLPGMVYQLHQSLDGTLSYPYISERCLDIYGISPQQAQADPQRLLQIYHPDDWKSYQAAFQQSATTLQPLYWQGRVCLPTGERWHQIQATAERQPDGTIMWYGILTDITERQQAKQVLHEQERQLRDNQEFIRRIADSSPNLLYIFDLEQQANIYSNRELTKFLGYGADDLRLLGDDVLTHLIHPGDLGRIRDHHQRLQTLADGEVAELEYRMRDAQGQWRWLHSREMAFKRNVQGYVSQIVGNAQDITARKQSEKEQTRLVTILEATTDLVGMVDVEGRIRYLNRAGQDLLDFPDGVDVAEFTLNQVTSSQYREHWQQVAIPTAIERGFWSGESQLRSLRGFEIAVSQVLIAHKNDEGQVEYFSTIMRDISDRKQTELALLEQEQFLRSIYDAAQALIFVVDVTPEGEFQYVSYNEYGKQLTGLRNSDIQGKTAVERFGEAEGAEVNRCFQTCLEQRAPMSREECLTFGDQQIWFLTTFNPLMDHEGRVYRLVATCTDITRLKQAEAKLRQQTSELQTMLQELQRTQTQMIQAEKMSGLGQLVAGVAHEINNPVNFIYGNLNHAKAYTNDLLHLTQLYQKHYPQPNPEIDQAIKSADLPFLIEDLPKLLESMKVGASRIQQIVSSLRTFSRMDEADMKAVDIHTGIDSTLMILRSRLKGKPSRAAIEVVKAYGNLPLVECYAGQLNQVFMNLLSNAIDALEEQEDRHQGTGETFSPRIIIQTRLAGHHQAEILIADNGSGIPDAIRDRIFNPFFTTKPIGKGTGMGLSISYQIVTERHSGSLDCISLPGQGTTFVIKIPLIQS